VNSLLTRLLHRIAEPPPAPLVLKLLLLVMSGILLIPVFLPGNLLPPLVALLPSISFFLLALSYLLRPHTSPLAVKLRVGGIVLVWVCAVVTNIYLFFIYSP
jgi:hypothetical protein